jgi:hypothetical protein
MPSNDEHKGPRYCGVCRLHRINPWLSEGGRALLGEITQTPKPTAIKTVVPSPPIRSLNGMANPGLGQAGLTKGARFGKQLGFRYYRHLLVDFALAAANRAAPAAPKKTVTAMGAFVARHYRDPLGAWSGVVKGSSLESTTKTASKLADSFSLAFSLIL